jgi:hypothetical protein
MIRSFQTPAMRLQPTSNRAKSPLLLALGLFLLAGCDGGTIYETAYEPATAIAEVAPVVAEAPRAAKHIVRVPAPRRGVITAGDIDDTLNLAAFSRYQARASRMLDLPIISLGSTVLAQLTGPDGKPAPGVPITLRKPGRKQPFYSGYSGVDGRIAVFPSALGHGALKQVELRAFGQNQNMVSHTLTTGHVQQITLPFDGKWSPDFLDLVFVIDVSGSMDDELAWLKNEFEGLVRDMRRSYPAVDLRFGLVAYQSPGDPFVIKNFGFTRNVAGMQGWLHGLEATGGEGGPEVVGRALAAAVDLPWRRGHGERLIFQIGDEPPSKRGAGLLLRAVDKAAKGNVQIFGLGASGTEDSLEYLLRQAALKTGGRYLFLTDDSGVGYAHAEPKIACYRVSSLRSLLKRVLSSELSGIRHEAGRGDIIREVGNYRNGVCLQ